MKHLLFVDDEPNILDGLRRSLRSMRAEWSIECAASGPQALACLERGGVDVVISDMRMPGMDGAQFLEEVRHRYPHVVRIVLSGQSDQDTVLRSVGQTHLYLTKPCDPDELKLVITRACALRDRLENPTVLSFVMGLPGLPSLPSLYRDLQQAVEANASLEMIGEIIAKDLGMATRILQLVNSAFFSLRRTIHSPAQAVSFLGLDTIRSLVVGLHAFSTLTLKSTLTFSPEKLWGHSMRVARLAKCIAEEQGLAPLLIDASFTAGLLHDIGLLILLSHKNQAYEALLQEARMEGCALHERERQQFGVTHAEVGACLLGLWGLTDPIVEAVTFHHEPLSAPRQDFGPLTAIHVADVLVDRAGSKIHGSQAKAEDSYLDAIGVSRHLQKWSALEDTLTLQENPYDSNSLMRGR